MKSKKAENKSESEASDEDENEQGGDGEDGKGKKWYENEEDLDEENKWVYMEHHGVTFPEPYIPNGVCPLYNGEYVKLTPYEYELAHYWCQSMESAYITDKNYVDNFQKQFMQRFKSMGKYTDFSLFDFSPIKNNQIKMTEKRKAEKEEKKEEKKRETEERNKYYNYAIVDWVREKTASTTIEPPTLFKGRGDHPRSGLLKTRITPEMITVNIAESAPIPICPIPGHAWGDIVHKHDVTWLCTYKEDTVNQKGSHKYVFLAPNSRFKGMNDRKKYEKARKLKSHIEEIRRDYLAKLESTDIKNKQLGTATYLIDKLALRVGNEKGEEEADTVGCCSLRVEHVKPYNDNKITLDFLGKDSMQYLNTVYVLPIVWKNIQLFMKSKEPSDDLFDKIDAQVLNDYLRGLMEGLTAKVFRTYNASITLQRELNKCKLAGLSMEYKKEKYDEANTQVAILCNHQRTVGRKTEENLKKTENEVNSYRKYLAKLLDHLANFSKKSKYIDKDNEELTLESGKPLIMKFPSTKYATENEINKVKNTIEKSEKKLYKKTKTSKIALSTSKTNYNDPRITVVWCKKNEVKIEKVFTKNLLSKFLWAMYTDLDWEF